MTEELAAARATLGHALTMQKREPAVSGMTAQRAEDVKKAFAAVRKAEQAAAEVANAHL